MADVPRAGTPNGIRARAAALKGRLSSSKYQGCNFKKSWWSADGRGCVRTAEGSRSYSALVFRGMEGCRCRVGCLPSGPASTGSSLHPAAAWPHEAAYAGGQQVRTGVSQIGSRPSSERGRMGYEPVRQVSR